MTVSKMLAASMMTAFLASPILLIGCGGDEEEEEAPKSIAAACTAMSEACGAAGATAVATCQALDTLAQGAPTCSKEFNALVDCASGIDYASNPLACAGGPAAACVTEYTAFGTCAGQAQ